MGVGAGFIILGIILYVLNITLVKFYIDKALKNTKESALQANSNKSEEKQPWEQTEKARMVPRWVKSLGVIAVPTIMIGIIIIIFDAIF